jgi:hypothetical protein
MASAPCTITGRICFRKIVSVVVVPLCPTRREICSIGTPASESSETKLCRSSRGVHSPGVSPAAATTLRNERRTRGISGCADPAMGTPDRSRLLLARAVSGCCADSVRTVPARRDMLDGLEHGFVISSSAS